ncbi:MAG: putative motility protein [Firmicutes bacterium]|nr:putative motility protein [Bacillota bacterium]
MDIAACSIASSQTNLRNSASVAVLKKAMDTNTESAQALISQLKTLPSGPPNLGNNIDINV